MSRRGRGKDKKTQGDGWEVWGGYMNAKRQKLQEQFDQDAPVQLKKEGSGSRIFSGISIHVNGYTKPSSDELKRLMMLHGGNYETYLYRTRVTHVIATNLTNSKVKGLKGLKVVRPEWITESIAAGKLLSYSKYLLYTAQSGGIQKGLQTYTTTEPNSDQSVVTAQSSKTETQSVTVCDNESDSSRVESFSTSNGDKKQVNFDDNNHVIAVTSDQGRIYNGSVSGIEVNERIVDHRIPPIATEILSNAGGISPGAGGIVPNANGISPNAGGKSPGVGGILPNATGISPNAVGISLGVGTSSRAVSSHVSLAKAGDPKFLNEFYSNSRLHFLSTWKAEWKSYVNELQNKGDNFPGRDKLRNIVSQRATTPDELAEHSVKNKYIMHIDMDCFFVSVGLRKRPDLKGKPVAVTHSRGKGAKPDPNSDIIYERRQRELKLLQGGKKGRHKGKPVLMSESTEGDTSFPDISDSEDSDDDVIDDVTDVATETAESFHSMAEIASCSYEARKAGVRNGMFMGRAKGICPELVTIPYDFDGYKAVSRILYDTVASYTHDIEAVSCDEMLIDCTDLLRNTGATPLEFSTLLRSEIYQQTGCTASAGIGSSILLARMATRKAKPNGEFYLTETLVSDYIKHQPVKDLPGVGWSLTKRFEALKVITCGDLQRISLESLQKEFGPKTGQSLYRYCRGLDERPIKIEHQRKSVSAEVNYGIRFTTDSDAATFLEELSAEVCTRLKNIKMKGKTITLKLMVRRKDAPKETSKFMGHGICNNFSKSVTLPLATDETRIVAKETVGIFRQHKVEPADLRGIGIQIQKLEPAEAGRMGTSKKLPSILNFTVNTKHTSSDRNKDNQSTENCVQNTSVHNSEISENDRTKQGTSKCDGASKKYRLETSIEDCTKTKHLQGRLGTSVSDLPGTSVYDLPGNRSIDATEHVTPQKILNQNKFTYSNDPSHNSGLFDNVTDTSVRSPDVTSRSGGQDFVEDLGRRLEAQSQLPPLPSFPDIKTPESAKTLKVVHSKTPEVQQAPQDVDYFPSPSQVDPDVLRELPIEIRKQIEKEIGDRRKRKKASKAPEVVVVETTSDAGCSHWQPDRGENSDSENQTKGGNKSEDKIVALPSPSQIDPSCLEALPESMQAEIRQAYAKQDSNRRVNVKGANTLQLKQAKSPVKSPGKNRRSPGKNSPNFKVPRGRPSGRGRKNTSSKKTLFKDQQGSTAQNTRDTTSSTVPKPSKHSLDSVLSSKCDNVNHSALLSTHGDVNRRSEDVINLCSDDIDDTGHCRRGLHRNIESDNYNKPDNYQEHWISDTIEGQPEHVSGSIDIDSGKDNCDNEEDVVSLCGAVTLYDVKLLVKEWISSTPVPQQEDEEVLMNYLHNLVISKNLELVDRLLKFMLRNIHAVNSAEWLYSLKRVYTYIQTVVYQIYGSRLASITL